MPNDAKLIVNVVFPIIYDLTSAFVDCATQTKAIFLNISPLDEHANAAEGGSDIVEPPELRQRLQQQQPPGRRPGLVTGVHPVMHSRRDLVTPRRRHRHRHRQTALTVRLCSKNPATFNSFGCRQPKYDDKRDKGVSEDIRATQVFAALCCCFLFLLGFDLFFTTVARGFSGKELFDISVRQNKSTAPDNVRGVIAISTSRQPA